MTRNMCVHIHNVIRDGMETNRKDKKKRTKQNAMNIQRLLSSHKIDNFNCARLVGSTDTDVAHIRNAWWPDCITSTRPQTAGHRTADSTRNARINIIYINNNMANLQYCRFMNYNTRTIWIMNAFIADIFLVVYIQYTFITCMYLILLANDIFFREPHWHLRNGCRFASVLLGF